MVEKISVLVEIFGGEDVGRVLNVLMDHPTLKYTKKDLAEVSGLEESELEPILEKFEELDMVKRTKEYIKTDTESDVIRALRKFELELQG